VTQTVSEANPAARLSRIAETLYVDGSPLLRLLQRYRPYICPFEELLPAVPPGSRMLDIGCGGGLFLALLAAEGRIRHGVGFDRSVQAIAVARRMSRRAAESVPGTVLEFREGDANERTADGPYDVVSLIDVMHHVPPSAQRAVLENAASQVRPSGLLIYKDMVMKPQWQAWANRLHDLVLARQWIHYAPIACIEEWCREFGLSLVAEGRHDRYCYGHELRVFRRAA
jgi:2-polyprenyl-3-methyl-5-hydroxy-6-metoxy-1,4-benzoquinol methylase